MDKRKTKATKRGIIRKWALLRSEVGGSSGNFEIRILTKLKVRKTHQLSWIDLFIVKASN